MYDNKSSFSKSALSSARLLNDYRGQSINLGNSSVYREKQKMGSNESLEDELMQSYQFDESLSQGQVNDFGYFDLESKWLPTPSADKFVDEENEPVGFTNLLKSTINKVNKQSYSLTNFNLVSHLNEISYEENRKNFPNFKSIISHFAKEENDYRFFEIPMPQEKKDLSGLQAHEMNDYDEVEQTQNSFIINKQYYSISQGNLELTKMLNFEYMQKKDKYELELLLRLVEKLNNSENPGSKITIDFREPYEELENESRRMVEEYNSERSHSNYKLRQFKSKSVTYLSNFITKIDNKIEAAGADKKTKNYVKWKKKVSELINIWQLFSSSGVELKFSVKYLILKKYFANRAHKRQNALEAGLNAEDGDNFLKQIFNALLGIQSKSVPRSIFIPDELVNICMEILMGIVLLYSLFSIPIIEFIGYYNDTLLLLSKFVEMTFFIDLVTNFRKVYKDKSNKYVFEINDIFFNYINSTFIIDLLSTFPWYFFSILNKSTYQSVKRWSMVFKILRVTKLSPIFRKLESLKIANYVRLFKLILIFFFFAHWMGCLLYSAIDFSLLYSEMNQVCYVSNLSRDKGNMEYYCRYMLTIYTSAYIIPGQHTMNNTSYESLNPSSEYIMFILQYMIGQVLSAYIFGGMASIIQNLNQGQNFFTSKTDILNEHMRFYEVDPETIDDVKIYFAYMWQRHKDVIYGKHHFDLLSKSLRERFERLNLPGNQFLLAKFYNLTPGNNKLIGSILINLSKIILFPYEILFSEGSVIRGIYILLNGDVELVNNYIKKEDRKKGEINEGEYHLIEYADVMTKVEEEKKSQVKRDKYFDESFSVVFPLISAFIKTGRNYQQCYSQNFTDLLFLPIKAFDSLVANFPIEMHVLKHKVMAEVEQGKLFTNSKLFDVISSPSSRSTKYYEPKYDSVSIWIPIPIPISQRKISQNYISSFTQKIRNQWREIMVIGDLDLGLNSCNVVSTIKNDNKKTTEEEINNNLLAKDPLDKIKHLSRLITNKSRSFVQRMDLEANSVSNW